MATQDNGLTAYISLGADINKQKGDVSQENRQGIASEKLPELELSMKNEDLVKLLDKWEKAWKESPKKSEWEKAIEENEKYWLGKQFDTPKADKRRPLVDNAIFEALETYLPQVTRRNPETLVSIVSSKQSEIPNPEYEAYVEKVKGKLTD